MTKNNRLYRELTVRVGSEEMQGINSLLENGHTGIAERHAVEKMVIYLRSLEQKLGIVYPDVRNVTEVTGNVVINDGDKQYFL